MAVAIEESIGDASLECGREVRDLDELNEPLHLLARRKPQSNGRDDAEQPVAADHMPEQGLVGRAGDSRQVAVRVDEFEPFDVVDDRLHGQPAAVDIGAEGTTEREAVGAGLLLADAPLAQVVALAR